MEVIKEQHKIEIDTSINNHGLMDDYKETTKQATKLVNQFDKVVDRLHKQQVAADNLQAKYNQIATGNKAPSDLIAMESQLKKVEKELDSLTDKAASYDSKIKLLNDTIKKYREAQDFAGAARFEEQLKKMTASSDKTKESIKSLSAEASRLQSSIASIKADPSTSMEAQSLLSKINLTNDAIANSKKEAEELADTIVDSSKKTSNFMTKGFDGVMGKIDSFKKRMTRMIGTVMVFRLFRKSLTALSSSFTRLIGKNDEFAKSLNQIKANLITAFTPVYNACLPAINSLMSALSKITGTIAVFVNKLFGKTADEAKANAKALYDQAKATKAVNEENEKLGNFDKLEVQEDDSKTSSGTPEVDFSGELQYSEKWVDKLLKLAELVKKYKKELAGIAGIVAAAFVTSKIVSFINSFSPLVKLLKKVGGLFVTVGEDGTKSLNKVTSGVTVAIAGFILMAKNVISLINDWDKLDTKQKILKAGFAALGAAAIALGVAIALGISTATLGIGALVAVVVTLITAITTFIVKLATEEKSIKSVTDAQNAVNEAQQAYTDANNEYVSAIDTADDAFNRLKEAQDKTGLSGEDLFNKVQAGTLDYANMTAEQKEVYKAYLDNEEAQKKVKEATEKLTEAKRNEKIASWESKLAVAAEGGQFDEYKASVIDAFNKGELSAEEARDLIGKSMSGMSRSAQKTFMEDLPDDIKNGLDPKNYETKGQKLAKWFGNLWDKIKEFCKTFFGKTLPNLAITGVEVMINKIIAAFEGLVNIPINAINGLIEKANKIPGVNIGKFNTISMGRVSIPRLAKGAVLPANKPFLAELGDQKHGKNLEAPESLIRQIIREENANSQKHGTLDINAFIQCDKKTLGRAAFEGIRLIEIEDGKQYFAQ